MRRRNTAYTEAASDLHLQSVSRGSGARGRVLAWARTVPGAENNTIATQASVLVGVELNALGAFTIAFDYHINPICFSVSFCHQINSTR